MLTGKGVSAGCGIGRAMIIREQTLEFTPKSGCEPEEEKRRLEEAVEGFYAVDYQRLVQVLA